MRFRSQAVVSFGIMVGSLLAVGCQPDAPTLPIPGKPVSSRGKLLEKMKHWQGVDREFGEIALSVPGFGGVYHDSLGRATVRITDPASKAAAQSAVRSWLVSRGRGSTPIQFVESRYDFIALKDWQRDLTPLMAREDVFRLDVDERTGVVSVGVTDSLQVASVEQAVRALGVPRDAFRVEVFPIPVLAAWTLNGRIRYLEDGWRYRGFPAGVQIQLQDPNDDLICTAGPRVYDGLRSRYAMLVASHCTDDTGDMGGVQGQEFSQPTNTYDAYVGKEYYDPGYFTNSDNYYCPAGFRCRNSDAALVSDGNNLMLNAGIARTKTKGTGGSAGSLEIDSQNPLFAINSANGAYTGDVVQKVGQSTGWTEGRVESTCVNVQSPLNTNYVLLCEDYVTNTKAYTKQSFPFVGQGDSGAPVFRILSGSSVEYNGILTWANADGSAYYVSDWDGIDTDFNAYYFTIAY